MFFAIFDESIKCLVGGEQRGVAYEHEPLAGTRHGHIELTVDDSACAFVNVLIVGEKRQLIFLFRSEAVHDGVALAALITFHGVDSDIVEPPLKYGPSSVWFLTRNIEDTVWRAV